MVSGPAIPGGWRDVASALDRSTAERPDQEALVGRHARYSYAELDRAIDAAAAALASLGVAAGDRVAACAANHPDIVIAFFAAQRLGAIWVGVNRPLAAPEKAYQLQDCGASVFLADAAARAQIEPLRGELPDLRRLVDMEPSAEGGEWRRLLERHAGAPRPAVAIDPHAPAAISYTSGTTGRPKGVVHSQHNMALVAATFHAGLRGPFRPTLRRGVTLPLTILNLMIMEALTALSGGGSLVCMDRADAVGIAEWVRAAKVEWFIGAPATVYDLLTRPEIHPQDLASLEFAGSGGSAVPDELRRLYAERFGQPLLGGYGLTEAPSSVTGTSTEFPLPAGSCGRGFAHLKIAILDAEGRDLAPGETGEICVRAAEDGPWAGVYTPMLAYWNRPEETAQTLRGGWLHTGDVGFINAEGDIFIRDRLKEMIIRGGANIYPAEVERVLTADPRVRDAAVIGKPDPRLGEIVVAFVELAPGLEADQALQDDLRAACAAQLAKYKLPELWRFVEALPRNAMNKVVKPRLKGMV